MKKSSEIAFEISQIQNKTLKPAGSQQDFEFFPDDFNKETGRPEFNPDLTKSNIISDERLPIIRLSTYKLPTQKSFLRESGSTTPRRKPRNTLFVRNANDSRMSGYFKQARANPSMFEVMQKSNATPLVHELNIILANMTPKQRLEKAARHLNDALYLRTVRHDIDMTNSKLIKGAYNLQTNLSWQGFLYFLSLLFLILTFFEPPSASSDTFFNDNPSNLQVMLAFEIPILLLFILEFAMEIYHKKHDPRTFKEKYLKNKVIICKLILNLLFIIDFIYFYSSLPAVSLRFSRALRPFCLALYSKELRRTFFGIIKSLRRILEIILFFVLMACVFAAIGVRIIGDFDGQQTYDPLTSNFNDFGPALNEMYILFTADNYPDVMIPAITNSPFYLFFFIPFVAINTLLFVPIPIAVIFDAFRDYRADLVVSERIKEREALVACFICLDVDKSGSVSKDEFMALFLTTYGNNLDEEKLDEVFEALNDKQQGEISLDTFFVIVELLEDSKSLKKFSFMEIKYWNVLRDKLNRIFKFDKIVNHIAYEIFMSLVVFFNTVILLYYAFASDDNVLNTLNTIDDYIVYVYVSEIIFKIIGLGLTKYFSDRWNIADFSLTIISLATDIAVSFAKVARTAKAGRLFRFARAQRAFKLIRVLRGFKLFRCCYAGVKSFNRIKRFFQNIMLCLPIVLKLTVILCMVSYVYAVVGMEIFNSSSATRTGESPYLDYSYADFDSLWGALLILFQVIVQASWSDWLYDYAWRFDNLGKASLYFNTFSSVTNYVIISLLTGLIWEVFTYMEKQFEKQDKIEEQLNEIYYSKSLKKTYATKKSQIIRSREASMSEIEFENVNDSQMLPKRQVKSLTSLEAPSTSARAEAVDVNYTHSDFRNDIKPLPRLRLIESMGPGTTTKNIISKGQPLLPSRFKLNVFTPSKSESQTALIRDLQRDNNEEDGMLDQGPSDIINNNEANDAFEDLEFPKTIDSPSKKSYLEEPISPEMSKTLKNSQSLQEQKRTTEELIDPIPAHRKWKSPSNPDTQHKRLSALTGIDNKGFATSLQELPGRDENKSHSKLYGKKMITRHFPDNRHGDHMPVIPDSEQSVENLDYLEEKDSQGEDNKEDFESLAKKIVNKRLQKLKEEEGSLDFGANGKLLSLPTRQHSRLIRKFGRSDSLNASLKLTQTTSGPVINKIFIEDMNDPQLEKTESKNLEKDFYMRKIVVCKHISTEKNQMGYIGHFNSKEKKEKFKSEKKLLKLDSSDDSKSDEDMAAGTKSEDELNVSEFKTKHLEGLRKKMKAKISQTADRILRKALLQHQNQNKIQRYEDEHFIEMYGNWFEYLKNPKIERIRDVFAIENKILVRFMRLLKQDEIISTDFVEIMHMIEESVNLNLLRKGSIGKFLFKDIQGKWFFVFKDKQKFRIHYLSAGFWNYSDEIFTEKTNLYEGQDILFPGTHEKYKDPVDEFYGSLTKISKKINKSTFEQFDKEQNLWNLYIVPFQTSSVKNLRKDLLKSTRTNSKLEITSIENIMITEGIFFSVNYIMNAKNMTNNQQDKRMDTNQIIEMEKSTKQELYKQYQSFVRTPKIIKKGNNRRSSLVVEVSGNASESPKARKGNKKKTVHEFLKSDTKDIEHDPSGKAAKIEEFLPLQEYLDFLRDMRDTINLHKDHLLCKVSALYSELHAKNKN